MNIVTQLQKWKHINTVRYALIMKAFIFFSFVWYTSISTLYLIDNFGFSELQTWLYLTFTGSFLIFHQALSIRFFIEKFRDRKTLLLWMLFMGWSFFFMWLAQNIVIFTIIYFFAILWISLCLATLGSLISRSVDEKNQWEIMWMSSSFESFISIIAPLVFTSLYTGLQVSPYLYIALIPIAWYIVSKIFFRNIEFALAKNEVTLS